MASTPAPRSEAGLPALRPEALPGTAAPRPEPEHVAIPLSYYWLLVQRYRGRICTLVLVLTAAAAVAALSMSKTYAATAIVRVDPSGLRVVGDETGPNGAGADVRLLVATEANVITSPVVEQALIDSLHLGDVPEFQSTLRPGASPTDLTDRLLRKVGSHIGVSQPLDTYLLNIQFRSKDPVLAARAANGLAQALLEHEYATRAKALTDSTAYMSDQVDALRARMEQDQTALVTYESANDVIDPDDKSNIYQARLSEINQELTQAEATRMSLEADAQVAASGGLDGLLASPRGEALIPLRDRYLTDQRELDHLSTIYGVAHPIYRQQQLVVSNDLQILQQQQLHLAAQITAQYAMALQNEQLLRTSLASEKASVDAFNLRAVRYHALKAAADSSTALYYDLQKQIQDATVAAGQRSENLRIISPATPSDIPVSPRIALWVAVAFLLSTLVGVGGAIMLGILDKSISSPEQVERWFNVPVLGSLPRVSGKANLDEMSPQRFNPQVLVAGESEALAESNRHSAFQEAVLAVHSALSFAFDGDATALAVTSSVPAEGKSTVVCNLAAAFAALGQRTLLVDADLRKPSVHRKFRLPNRMGLSNVLRGRCTLADAVVSVTPALSVLTAGPTVSKPAELLHLAFEEVLEQMVGQFGFVLVDCPPVLGFADTSNIAAAVGRVLVVTYAGSTDRGNLNAALRQLGGAGANLVGVILNRVSPEVGHYYGYYNQYGYSHYAETEDEAD